MLKPFVFALPLSMILLGYGLISEVNAQSVPDKFPCQTTTQSRVVVDLTRICGASQKATQELNQRMATAVGEFKKIPKEQRDWYTFLRKLEIRNGSKEAATLSEMIDNPLMTFTDAWNSMEAKRQSRKNRTTTTK